MLPKFFEGFLQKKVSAKFPLRTLLKILKEFILQYSSESFFKKFLFKLISKISQSIPVKNHPCISSEIYPGRHQGKFLGIYLEVSLKISSVTTGEV